LLDGSSWYVDVASLPPHHRDPCERLLIAQAQVEQVAVRTADRQLERYELKVKWA
jgi:PIN domain nuclease of toxin-antitoxin system